MPWLAALVCASAFDLAVHDAFGILHGLPTYETYGASFLNADLAHYLSPDEGSGVSFRGRYPAWEVSAREYVTWRNRDRMAGLCDA